MRLWAKPQATFLIKYFDNLDNTMNFSEKLLLTSGLNPKQKQ